MAKNSTSLFAARFKFEFPTKIKSNQVTIEGKILEW